MPSLATFALKRVFHGPGGTSNPEIRVLDYGDPDVFRTLWLDGLDDEPATIGGEPLDWTRTGTHILLIGNDPPDGSLDSHLPSLRGINFRGHFTAASWLAAWRIRFPNATARIAVIDPRETSLASGTARALQSILAARETPERHIVPGVAVLNAPSLDDICQWLAQSGTDSRTLAKDGPHLGDLLRSTIWNELTSTREQHHAMSNVIGAFLLSAQVGKGHPHPPNLSSQDFLLALVRACGIDVELERFELMAGKGLQRWIAPGLQQEIEGAVFIDDMSDLWEHFLRGASGFAGDIPFGETGRTLGESLVSSPHGKFFEELDGLPGRLSTFLVSGSRNLSAGDLVSGQHQIRDHFVLFLDLRLFPKIGRNATGPGEEEKGFLKKVAAFGIQLLESGRNLPWLPDDAARQKLRAECEAVINGPFPAAPETLLPRLIALLDPTLPIVIFSSSHRSELIDPFRDCGNVITTFRKPVLSGLTRDWAETVKELHSDFGAAMEQVARILRVRRSFSVLCRVPSQSLTWAGSHKAVEVFIDESYFRRTNVYAIGAIALTADSHRKIREFCRRLEEENLHWGLSANNRNKHVSEKRSLTRYLNRLECERKWFVDIDSLPKIFLGKMAERDALTEAWRRISNLARECEIAIHSVALGCEVTAEVASALQIPSLQGVARDQADELHRELAKSLLLCLFVVHPEVSAVLRAEDASLAIDVGTRTASPGGYSERFEDTYQSFGIAYTDHNLNVPTLQERCDLWNQELDWAKNQDWWNRGDIRARIANGRIEPDERDLSEWLGCFVWSPRRKMISVSSYDGLNYLRETLASLNQEISPNIVRARGCALFDFEDTRDWMTKLYTFPCFPYQPHYLADWIARSGVELIGEPELNNPLAVAFVGGFASRWGGAKRRLLHAVLRLDNNDESGGLKSALEWLEEDGTESSSCALETQLLARCHRSIASVSGNSLRSLFALAARD